MRPRLSLSELQEKVEDLEAQLAASTLKTDEVSQRDLTDLYRAISRAGTESIGHPRVHGADSHVPRHNLDADADPTSDDDKSEGYGPGSFWVNTTDDAVFVCLDGSSGAAVWTDDFAAVRTLLILAKSTLTIDANDEVTVPTTSWVYLTSASATDNLDGIGSGVEGQVAFLTPTAGKDITLVHNGTVTSGDPLLINGEANVTLDQDHDLAIAIYDATATAWIVMVPGSGGGGGGDNIADSDGDTKIQTEESADEDILRFDTGGTERAQMDASGLHIDDIVEETTDSGVTIESVIARDSYLEFANISTPASPGTAIRLFGQLAGTLVRLFGVDQGGTVVGPFGDKGVANIFGRGAVGGLDIGGSSTWTDGVWGIFAPSSIWTANGTPSVATSTTADEGRYANFASAATAAAIAGPETNNSDWYPNIGISTLFKFQVDSVADVDIFIGLTELGLSTQLGHDAPGTNADYIGLQFCAARQTAYSPTVTLAANINSTTTTITYTSTGDPITGGDIIYIDSERILVGSVDTGTNTLSSCTRGYHGTTAAAHTSGAAIEEGVPDTNWQLVANSTDFFGQDLDDTGEAASTDPYYVRIIQGSITTVELLDKNFQSLYKQTTALTSKPAGTTGLDLAAGLRTQVATAKNIRIYLIEGNWRDG